ncbi:hypothetical protein BS78_K068300 [Paspalum vaginatum]|uniref:Uncharacterized protein n=1 Tax=Paspalum vaginatum TaxID=158149 RepID=A0A9W7XCS5_9POAL|nr:hypothetical protein BS78_K068300 [Paspalum vaginatum]
MPQEDLEKRAKESGITVDQLLGRVEVEPAEEVWKFVHGRELIKSDLVKALQTQMRRFHGWYMKISKRDPHHLIVVRVQDRDDFSGVEIFYLDFKDIYEIYHQGWRSKGAAKRGFTMCASWTLL